MTLRTPEEPLNCVDSTIFAEVELTHYWTLQPPLGRLPKHPQVDRRVLFVRRQSQRGVCRELPAPRLPDLHRRDARLLAVQLRRSVMEPCSSTVYTRVCRTCGHPAGDRVYCGRCANR